MGGKKKKARTEDFERAKLTVMEMMQTENQRKILSHLIDH
jgi:hypothetical protein